MREPSSSAPSDTPTGKFLGRLKDFRRRSWARSPCVKRSRARASIRCGRGMHHGQRLSAGVGTEPRPAGRAQRRPQQRRRARSPSTRSAAPGLKAVMLAAQGIALGDIDVAVAGGMESMSNAPYLLPRAREGLRMGDASLVDSMIHDGLWCAFEHCHMGVSGEHVAESVRRVARGAGCLRRRKPSESGSGRRRRAIQTRNRPGGDSAGQGRLPIVDGSDETIRPDSTPEMLKGLKPAFKKDGSVTAGNAPGVNDGAAALVVMSEDARASLGAAAAWRASRGRPRAAWRRSWC